jgi:hypothetical protein
MTRSWSAADLGTMDTFFQDPGSDLVNPVPTTRPSCASTDARLCNDNNIVQSQGNCATFDSTRTVLTLRNNCAVTLPTGTYDLCGLVMGNGSSIQPQNATSAIRILFDSAARKIKGTTTPACAATNDVGFPSGTLFLSNAADVKQAQLYVYGNPSNPSSHTFSFQNAANFHFLLKAPNSIVQVQNASGSNAPTMFGGIAAWAIEMQNNLTFRWDPNVDAITTGSTPVFYRTSWMQCSRPADAASAISGC